MTERKVVVFRAAGQEYAADVRHVREVIASPEVTRLPRAEAPVAGVFNLRGNIVTALDGAAALGVRAGEDAPTPRRAVVADAGGRLVALLVDSASEVLTVREDDVRAAPAGTGREDVSAGVIITGGRAIVLVDLPRLARREARAAGEEVPA